MHIPDELKAALIQVGALRKKGEVGDALEILSTLEKDEKFSAFLPTIWCNFGEYYFRTKHDPESAIPYYEKAVKGNPEDSYAISGLGTCYRVVGLVDEAIACLEAGLTIHPQNEFIKNTLLRAQERKEYLAAGAQQKMVPVHAPAMPSRPDTPDHHQEVGQHGGLSTRLQKIDKESLLRAVQARPREVGPRQVLMRLLAREGDIGGTQAQAQAILEIDKQNSEAKKFLRTYPVDPQVKEAVENTVAALSSGASSPRVHVLSKGGLVEQLGQTGMVPSVPQPVTLQAMEEWVLTVVLGDGTQHEITFELPASEGPLRLELVDPLRGKGDDKKGFVVAREIKHGLEPS